MIDFDLEKSIPAPPKAPETSPTWIHSTFDLRVPADNPGVPNVPGRVGKAEGKGGIFETTLGSGKEGSGEEGVTEAQGGEKAKNRWLAEHFAFNRKKALQFIKQQHGEDPGGK